MEEERMEAMKLTKPTAEEIAASNNTVIKIEQLLKEENLSFMMAERTLNLALKRLGWMGTECLNAKSYRELSPRR